MNAHIRNGLLTALVTFMVFSLQPRAAQAALADDLQNLVIQAQDLDSRLAAISLNSDTVCGPLVQANQAARDLVNSITLVDESLAAPLQVDEDSLSALDELFSVGLSLANEGLRLSVDLQSLSQLANAITIKDGITATLQLSDDIGTMADRIGEMADKILVMSDNIGLMADRILATQEIQNQNILLTQQTILQTQTNMLTLVSVVETGTNDLSFDKLVVDGQLLAARMAAVLLNPWTMAKQLKTVALDVHNFLNEVTTTLTPIAQQTTTSTMYINQTSLTSLANMSIMLTSLSTAVDGYVIAINGLKAITSASTLADSLKSMLQLSADIGIMANRILEMGDQILAMADNIGMEADQILVTQQLQSANVAMVQTSILAAQEMAISIIVARKL
ncbi:MAG: hypothetical protein KKA54_02745 [Proteobacteria bacterium]|nr:hypothetical protein [Pseudomonadota bacterium]MBU0965278.1 hypothetical protein [Pseudomonadota bacterium]